MCNRRKAGQKATKISFKQKETKYEHIGGYIKKHLITETHTNLITEI
jgi:hypothetical protein